MNNNLLEKIDLIVQGYGTRDLDINPTKDDANFHMIYQPFTLDDVHRIALDFDLYRGIFSELNNRDVRIIDDLYMVNINYATCPKTTAYLCLMREHSFRQEGVGVGKLDFHQCDVDPESSFSQMIMIKDKLQDPRLFVGAYCHGRYSEIKNIDPLHGMCTYSEEFKRKKNVQLRRACTNSLYRNTRTSMYSVFHGMGYLVAQYEKSENPPEAFYGKVTLPYFLRKNKGTDLIVDYCQKNWTWTDLIQVEPSLRFHPDPKITSTGKLYQELAARGYKPPPMIGIYEKCVGGDLTKIKTCGAVVNKHDGNSVEVSVMVNLCDFDAKSRKRYIEPYQ